MADDARRVRAPPPAAAVRQRPDAGRHAPRLHRRALPRPAGRGPRRRPRPGRVRPTSSSASPARPTTTSSARSRWSPRRSTTAPTPSSSAPAGHRGGGAVGRASSTCASCGERFERLRVVVERSALARHRARVGRVEEVLVEGPSKKDPPVVTGRTGQNKLVHFRPGRPVAPRHVRRRRDHRRRPAPPHGRAARGHGRAAHRTRIPVLLGDAGLPAVSLPGPAVSASGPRGSHPSSSSARPASGKSALALGRLRTVARRREIVVVDSMQVYRGMDIGTAKPTPAEQAEVPHHLPRPGRPRRRLHGRRCSSEAGTTRSATSRPEAPRPLLVGGTGLYLRAVVDGLDLPGQCPDVRSELEREPDTGRAAPPPRRGSTRWPPAAWSRPTGAGSCGPSRSRSAAGGRSRRSARASTRYPDDGIVQIGLRWPRPTLLAGSRPASGAARRRPPRRGPALADATGGSVPDRRAGPRLQGAAGPPRRRVARWTRPSALAVSRTRRFAGRQERWFRRDPRIRWVRDGP